MTDNTYDNIDYLLYRLTNFRAAIMDEEGNIKGYENNLLTMAAANRITMLLDECRALKEQRDRWYCQVVGIDYDEFVKNERSAAMHEHPSSEDKPEQLALFRFSDEFKAKYGFGGWDDPRPTSECLHCNGTGKSDEHNECGFCFPDEDCRNGSVSSAETVVQENDRG